MSSDKRNTLIQAAIQTIATQGLSATAALIAKNATRLLFTYFDSKEALLNKTYLEIKRHIVQAVMPNFPQAELAILCSN